LLGECVLNIQLVVILALTKCTDCSFRFKPLFRYVLEPAITDKAVKLRLVDTHAPANEGEDCDGDVGNQIKGQTVLSATSFSKELASVETVHVHMHLLSFMLMIMFHSCEGHTHLPVIAVTTITQVVQLDKKERVRDDEACGHVGRLLADKMKNDDIHPKVTNIIFVVILNKSSE
jgi:hypothetical protein